ncbi:hypothetical protein [Dietzia sp. PP-33]|jgi:hypothetical protein|uniref:hypothetical protein n=1 Tax=Dietzia sp. PP-33 TaxID=2957500 RepID=UPI0029A4F6FA|nr:hypothetical protein [Dietzia sp. PP-33]MDX2358425.1 hypothetical protein [Dietzia sp. PP-33]
MTHTATDHPLSRTGRRRVPAVIALAMAAGVALAGCSAAGENEPAPSPTTQATTSSSSSTPTTTSPTVEAADPVSATAAAPTAPATSAASAASQLPANVVGTGGPCHRLGELAQADDGSPLFCTEDPGGAGPLWLPQPQGTGPDGTGPALQGQPCMQEGVAVTAPEGTVLTCRLTGGAGVPGGLFWQR